MLQIISHYAVATTDWPANWMAYWSTACLSGLLMGRMICAHYPVMAERRERQIYGPSDLLFNTSVVKIWICINKSRWGRYEAFVLDAWFTRPPQSLILQHCFYLCTLLQPSYSGVNDKLLLVLVQIKFNFIPTHTKSETPSLCRNNN